MRDFLLAAIFAAALIPALRFPHIAAYLWAWLGLMSPHQSAWGFARSIPFSQIAALVALISFVIGKQRKLNVVSPETVILALLVIWVCITTVFAIFPDGAQEELDRFLKIQLFIFITIAVMSDRSKLQGLVWVMVVSIGFYGTKGGVFTILTGGSYHVLGPEKTFIGDNNTMALANLMVIPLIWYLYLETHNRWIKYGLLAATLLTTAAVLGSQSRGAFLGLIMIGVFFWWKSPNKFGNTLVIAFVALMIFNFMPQSWWDRMNTIESYEEDSSANERLNAWSMAINIANERPLGGGARTAIRRVCAQYAPNPEVCYDFHSIYFEMLGEQGWVGLSLFLTLWILTWLRCGTVVKRCRHHADKRWAANLALMVQVSLIGYLSGGAFLGLAYYDFPYYLLALAVITRKLIDHEDDQSSPPSPPVKKPPPRSAGFGSARLPAHNKRFSNSATMRFPDRPSHFSGTFPEGQAPENNRSSAD
jgi:probable O-glycosylation ligase (exosortase A-associated)